MRKSITKKIRIKDFEDKDNRIECALCKRKITYTSGGLVRHLKAIHNMNIQDYYLQYISDDNKCKCGCDKVTTWQVRGGYFLDYRNGHNYCGKTKENDESVKIRAKKMIQHENWKKSIWKKGDEPWNKGETKETNKVMKQISEKMSGENSIFYGKTKETCDALRRSSETAKKSWARGKRTSPFTRATKEQRKQWSKQAIITMNKNSISAARRETGIYETKSGKKYKYDSSWELMCMQKYDNDSSIKSWKRCDDTVDYVDDTQTNRTYNPDFEIYYDNNSIVIEEVKGVFSNDTISKMKAAKKFYKRQNKKYRLITFNRKKQMFYEITSVREIKTLMSQKNFTYDKIKGNKK